MSNIIKKLGRFESQKPTACSVCNCPVQWRPFESVPWQCFDCFPSNNPRIERFARILEPTEPAGWRKLLATRRRRAARTIDDDKSSDVDLWPPGRLSVHWLRRPTMKEKGERANTKVLHCARCRSSEFIDIPIHGGWSIRMDCTKCGQFFDFVKWKGQRLT